MDMQLYHGSVNVIEVPEFGKGNPKNDYGLGFYCTESLELAKEWACVENRDGFANKYLIDMSDLTVCNLSDRKYHILNWLAVLLENRTFVLSQGLPAEAKAYILETYMPDYKGCDIVRGYRADDSYFSFANAFLNNTISLEQLGRAMYLGKLGEQVVLKSEKAFGAISFQEAVVAENETYYPKRNARTGRRGRIFRKRNPAGMHMMQYI